MPARITQGEQRLEAFGDYTICSIDGTSSARQKYTGQVYRHREALPRRIAEKKIEKSGDAAAENKGGGRGKCDVRGSEKHIAHKHCRLCRRLEHRTRNCEERGAKKGGTLAKMNVPANSEVRWQRSSNDNRSSWRWQRRMGFGFRCDIPHIPYTRQNDCLQEGACEDEC